MKTMLPLRLFTAAAVVIASLAFGRVDLGVSVASAAAAPNLGDKVVDYCRKNMGKKIGSGQCAALAFQALREAGARTRAGKDFPKPGDYVWGRLVYLLEATPDGRKATGNLSDVRRGDIVQYRDARLGRAHFGHHTAVVAGLEEYRLKVYQQNVGGTQHVVDGAVRLDKLSAGWLRIYRPVPAGK
jgi:hypothetical protein